MTLTLAVLSAASGWHATPRGLRAPATALGTVRPAAVCMKVPSTPSAASDEKAEQPMAGGDASGSSSGGGGGGNRSSGGKKAGGKRSKSSRTTTTTTTTSSSSSSSKRSGAARPTAAPPRGEPCNVALTHTNADFDSLAGAVALAKLWSVTRPDEPTHVVMPRGVNPLVGRFLAYHKHLLPVRGFNTIRAEDVRAVGVVDTQTMDRLGPAASWLANASHVAVYDHHSGVSGDINPQELVLEPVGSATTVLVERLREVADGAATAAGEPPLKLTEAEATLFALGIRADTGALSYPDTTVRDGHALLWLMEKGASQTAIAEFGQARLSAVQRDLLASAMSSVERHTVEGLKLGVVQLDTGRGFVTGMAAVAEELLQLMSYDVLLLGVRHQNSKGMSFLSLIGRGSSRARDVDLNAVMAAWQGGGHPAAAAASVRLLPDAADADAADVEAAAADILGAALEAVVSMVPAQVTAAELMTKTVFACPPDETMSHALQLMDRVQKKAIPVVESSSSGGGAPGGGGGGKFLGMLKYRDVMKAAHAGKEGQMVKAWMRREVATVFEDTPYSELEEMMISSTGRLPVLDREGTLLGIVTRTDVLRHHNLYDGMNRRVL